jgi:predicted transcriptional regulator
MKLPINKRQTRAMSYKVSEYTIKAIESLAKENKCTKSQIIDYAIEQLLKDSPKD